MSAGDKGLMLLKRTAAAAGGKPAQLQLIATEVPKPTVTQADEILIRVGAAPINPSDMGGLLMGGDRLDEAETWAGNGTHGVNIPLPDEWSGGVQDSEWQPLGNEGAGVVVDAGKDAKHLMGKTVFFQGGSYCQFHMRSMEHVQVQPDGVTPKQAASSFVNPMTVLGMLEKMRREGHSGIVHTAAASQLGQQLLKVCLEEKVPLVNVVRRPQQVKLLQKLGAEHVVSTASATFREDLTKALTETGATIAFDAIGGGDVASVVLECMEAAAWARGATGSSYGSSVWKQVYNYGRLDPVNPTFFSCNYGGYRWNIGGYLVSDFLETVSKEWMEAAKSRIASSLETTFLTTYGKEVSLVELLEPANLKLTNAKVTGKKVLVVP